MRGLQFLEDHWVRCVRLAAAPAVLWLALKSIPPHVLSNLTHIPFLRPESLADGTVALFAVAWFRYAIDQSRPAATGASARWSLSLKPVLRFFMRSTLMVVGMSALLILPTMILAIGWILFFRPAAITPDTATHAVGTAFPLAILLLSPLLVRLYAYYAAVIAGRHDVTPLDAWRWMRGKSLAFIVLIAGVLAPAILCLRAVEALGLGVLGYGLAMPVLFACVALAAAASARAMADLISPPLFAATAAE